MAIRRSSLTPVAIALTVLLVVVQQGTLKAASDGPSVQDCQGHIQAAIRDFLAGHSSPIIGHEPDSPTSIEEASDEVQQDSAELDHKNDSGEDEGNHIVPDVGKDEAVSDTSSDEDEAEAEAEAETELEVDGSAEEEDSSDAPSAHEKEAEDVSGEQDKPQTTDDDDDDDDGSEESTVDNDKHENNEIDDSKEHDFQEGQEHEAETDDASEEDATSEEVGIRDRRSAESSEVPAHQSETDDANDESQEEEVESHDDDDAPTATVTAAAADSAESGHGNVSDSPIDRSDSSAEGDEHSEEEETATKVVADDDVEQDEEEEVLVAGPGELKSREPIDEMLGTGETEVAADDNRERVANIILKDVKKIYENAVKPLEQLYKFKDISNRHIGDAEIFSKPMILFMGPWSTGKSAIINYLLGTEYSRLALKTGAEPTSTSFTVLTYGETEQTLDGTQIAADWAFSTLQKFGQTFLDRLNGRKLPNRLLQKMTIVDTPGIFENRKSTVAERQRFPLNDAFQWFIDRADLIYVVFDPSKLDVGPELEALFDQLKGRESHVRVVLNKADTVRPSELMRVQATLLWNLSPEMGSSEAPTVFVGSFWSRPYLPGAPTTLLDAQQEAFLEDLAAALDSRVETKVALARRHAVRVRNHAKMVDCYLKTYYDHKSFFGNRRKVADDIVDNPHEYHIYEGLSAMTNVSRYDLPDPDVYREFFRLHPLFDFKPLASTCSYFKGCPLDKLDIAIAYDMPELVGKYQKLLTTGPQKPPAH